MKISLSKNSFIFVFLIVLFRVLLEFSYLNVINKHYEYQGFHLNFSSLNYFSSWGVFFLGFYFVKERIYYVSDYFFITALLGVLTPLSILYGYDYNRSVFPLFVVLLSFYFIFFIKRISLISFDDLPLFKSGRRIVIHICIAFVFFLVLWYFISGVSFNLDFMKVYEFREANSSLSGGGILNYTNNWTHKVFNIVLFSTALLYRKYWFALITLFVQVYFYAASAHKGVFFLPFLILSIWFYFKKTNSLVVVPLTFSIVILITILTYIFFDSLTFSSLFSRRVFFIPAHLTFSYFEFFSDNQFVYWSNSVLSSFITYPYDLPLTNVIGGYLGDEEEGANNGFIASGFAHAGLLGVFIYSAIIGVILRFIDTSTRCHLPLWFAVALTAIPLRNLLTASDLLTVMLTHGFLIALIVILLMRRKPSIT